jgi:RNA polymerase primary sigma factor
MLYCLHRQYTTGGATVARGKIYSPLLKELANMPDVTEDDNTLIAQFKDGDDTAGFKLLVKHYKMIVKVILDTTGGRWYDDDCLQSGALGLYEAARRYDNTLGYKFLTYAVHWIRKYVILEVCADSLPMAGLAFGRDFRERLYRYIGHKMTGAKDEEIAEIMGLNPKEIEKLSRAAHVASRPVSLNQIKNAEEEEQTDYDMDGVPATPGADEIVLDAEFQAQFKEIFKTLPAEGQFILAHTAGLEGCEVMQKRDIAKSLGVTMPEFVKLRRKAYKDIKVKLRELGND